MAVGGDRYGRDVLARDPHRPRLVGSAKVAAELGLVVEDAETGWVGAIIRVEKAGGMLTVALEDRHGRERSFRMGPGFLIDGEPVTLVRAAGPGPGSLRRRTASGSLAVAGARARVARQSRIWVEGRHDAELVAKVWGEDLALEGVVVEMLDGIDNLPARARDFGPEAGGARLGVLVDHLVDGSKEQRVARAVEEECEPGSILILGHPYVDIWQAVKPRRLGLAAWPRVGRGEDWKTGLLRELGWRHRTTEDVAAAWRRILGAVGQIADLEPSLTGRVEELIDFVTAPAPETPAATAPTTTK
ncbi:MAG: DUF3097 domain-containing protein [Bifidobacteriaceae bacterium]|jgi:hypothetical protein|nr:DUF3097 domain-containing protein [Bifidobacteriaceae bacterium]